MDSNKEKSNIAIVILEISELSNLKYKKIRLEKKFLVGHSDTSKSGLKTAQ